MDANDGDIGANVQLDIITINIVPEVAGTSRLTGKLPISIVVSKQADVFNLVVDDQGFQTATSKSTKKIRKRFPIRRAQSKNPTLPDQKVGASRPFK